MHAPMKELMFLFLSVFDFFFWISCLDTSGASAIIPFTLFMFQLSVDVLSKPLLLYLASWPGVLLFCSQFFDIGSSVSVVGCSCVESGMG